MLRDGFSPGKISVMETLGTALEILVITDAWKEQRPY